MPKKAKQRRAKKSAFAEILSHPGTHALIARVTTCNKPPIQWLKQGDGSWLECTLKSDCTYGNCHEVPASEVPPEVRGG